MDETNPDLQILKDLVVSTFEKPISTSRRGFFARIELLLKRAVRKCTRFLLKPYADGMHNFQVSAVNAISRLYSQMAFSASGDTGLSRTDSSFTDAKRHRMGSSM